jgi:hypothetical protein
MKHNVEELNQMSPTNLPAIDALSVEAKRQLLAKLARDLLATSTAPLSVEDAAGEVVIYTVPPDARARAERAMREADPARLAELRRRAATPEKSFSVEEVLGAVDSPADQNR